MIKKKIRQIAVKDRYKGAPWMVIDPKLITTYSLSTELPPELQELKAEYERKHKVGSPFEVFSFLVRVENQ